MLLKQIISFLLYTGLLPTWLLAQANGPFEVLKDFNGNPVQNAVDILQDRDGDLWLITAGGLWRFDGIKVQYSADLSPGSSDNNMGQVRCAFEDDQNRLWVGTWGSGIYVSDPSKSYFQSIQIGETADLNFHHIAQDRYHQMWLASDQGLIVIEQREDGIFQQVTGNNPIMAGQPQLASINTVFEDSEHRIWIGGEDGLYLYDEKWISRDMGYALLEDPVDDIQQDRQGKIWISRREHENQLMTFNEEDMVCEPFRDMTFSNSEVAVSFCFDHDERIWVTSFGNGLRVYDYQLRTEAMNSSSLGLSELFLRNPMVDDFGNVWLCGNNFLQYSYPQGFHNFKHNKLDITQDNLAIMHHGTHLYLSYREGGIISTEGIGTTIENGNPKIINSSKDSATYMGLLAIEDNRILALSYRSLSIFGEDLKIIASFDIPGIQRTAISDSEANLWVGGFNGLQLFSPVGGVNRSYNFTARENMNSLLNAIVEDPSGKLWLGTGNQGLALIDLSTDSIVYYNPESSRNARFPSWHINDMVADTQHNVWIGTIDGLIKREYSSGRFIIYGRDEGLTNEFVTGVLIDDAHRVWVSTHDGISFLEVSSGRFRNYSASDGLVNNGYNLRSRAIGPDGTLYFGGTAGIDYFHPDLIRTNPYPPKLSLEVIPINTEEGTPAEHYSPVFVVHDGLDDKQETRNTIDLFHRNRLLGINLRGIHLGDPYGVTYSYRLSPSNESKRPMARSRF